MNVGAYLAQSGISMAVFEPFIDLTTGNYYAKNQLVDSRLVEKLQAYGHELSNSAGYSSISVTIGGNQSYIDEWYESGVGRHVEVYNTAGAVICAGFVNRLTVSSSTLQASRGPLTELCNRCSVAYTPILDVSVSPPITGSEKSTILVDNTVSQENYGIIEKVLSGGQLLDDGTTNEAEDYRDRYIDENKDLRTSDKGLSLGNSGQPSVSLEILGYYAWLDFYIYSSIAVGTTTLSAKMQTVLGADPNGVISSNYVDIESNALLVANYDNDNRTAKTIIEEMVKRGNDTTDARRIFGVFEGQRAIYQTIPDYFDYYYKLGSRNQNIRIYASGENGMIVKPWDVQAGKWLFIGDFLPGRFTDQADKKDDPRAMFIESVSFSAPYGLSVNGIGVSELAQYLAKMGVK